MAPRRDDEGSELWRRVTAGIRPLRRDARLPAPHPPVSRPLLTESGARRKPAMPEPAAPPPPAPPPALAHGDMPGLDRRNADRLRRGRLPVEARLDLHGLFQDEAHSALSAFLARSQAAGRRCVLVVTGKGMGAEGGVLRREVPRWLNMAPNRARILAFCHAQPRDGGSGALYILLKRLRPA
ncbi:MAG: Smr/MutS family protein [Alphaproteobacteria bacterium]